MLEERRTHSLSDFVRNAKAHVARMKETRTPEVLTVNGRAEVVLLDAETYQVLVERAENADTIAAIRAHLAQARKNEQPQEPATQDEIAHSRAVVEELMAETERLGLYR